MQHSGEMVSNHSVSEFDGQTPADDNSGRLSTSFTMMREYGSCWSNSMMTVDGHNSTNSWAAVDMMDNMAAAAFSSGAGDNTVRSQTGAEGLLTGRLDNPWQERACYSPARELLAQQQRSSFEHSLQGAASTGHLQILQNGTIEGSTSSTTASDDAVSQYLSAAAAATVAAWHQQLSENSKSGDGRTTAEATTVAWDRTNDKRPAGCHVDAIKLFVGNVPKTFSKGQLLPYFNTFGKVEDLVIVKNKTSHESKGSAFLWYTMRESAERALLHFNQNNVIPDDGTNSNQRPLVLREAKPTIMVKGPRQAGQQHGVQHSLGSMGDLSGFDHASLGWLPAGSAGSAAAAAASVASALDPGMHRRSHLMAGLDSGSGTEALRRMLEQLSPSADGRSPSPSHFSLGGHMSPQAATNGAGHHGMDNDPVSMQSLSVTHAELALFTAHLFSVRTISGAQLSVTPTAPELFSILISGTAGQVDMAKLMIKSIIGNNSYQG